MSNEEISRTELQELVRAYYEAETKDERRAIWHSEGLSLPGGARVYVRSHVEPPEITFHHVPCALTTTFKVGLQYKPKPEPGGMAGMQISGPWILTDEQKLQQKAHAKAYDTAEKATDKLNALNQLARAAERQQRRYQERAAGYRKAMARCLCSWSYVTGEDLAARMVYQHAKPEKLFDRTYSPVPEAFTAQVVQQVERLKLQFEKYASAACFWYMVAAYSEAVEASLLETGRLPEMNELVDWDAEPDDGRAKATQQQKRAAVKHYYEAAGKTENTAKALGQTLEFLLGKDIDVTGKTLRNWIGEYRARF